MTTIKGYHAHIYFDESTLPQARKLINQAGKEFELSVGEIHEKSVGPHTKWSCQLPFTNEQFSAVIPWLALNRAGLTVFIHPLTDNDLKDHTDYAIWMGTIEPLKLDIF